MKAVVLALSLVGCTVERSVFDIVPDACEQALFTGSDGQSCDFIVGCSRPDPLDASCIDSVKCLAQGLSFSKTCMVPCTDDTQCMHGLETCVANLCEPCHDTSGCPACPAGFLPLERNGCLTCDCGPASTCTPGGASSCAINDVCYAGADCVPGCVDGDPDCCSDQCAAKGCKAPIPTGCLVQCSTGTQTACGGACITDHCVCMPNGEFQCTSVCAHGAQSSCVGP